MTAVDFRNGGYDDGYAPHGSRRADAHPRHAAWDGHDDDPGWDEAARYSTDAEGDFRAGRDGVAARVARLLNYVGALVSVALMVGLLVWGYRLVTRDVSGVPVIRALAGEARVTPDEPGGRQAEGRGLAVNAVAAGDGKPRVDQVEMAPAAAGLATEDVAMGELGATVREPGRLAEIAPAADVAPVLATSDAEARAAEAQRLAAEKAEAERVQAEALAAATQAQVVAAVAALPETSAEPATDAPVDSAVTDLAGAPAQAEAIGTALAEAGAVPPVAAHRPAPRPQRLAAAAAAAPASAEAAPEPVAAVEAAPEPAPVALAEAAPVEAAPEKPAPGATVVQIGAFDSDRLARGEWSRVSGKNGALFSGKSQVVQETKRNGRTFWRLRVAGFSTRDEARAFCAELKASGTDCIPTAAN